MTYDVPLGVTSSNTARSSLGEVRRLKLRMSIVLKAESLVASAIDLQYVLAPRKAKNLVVWLAIHAHRMLQQILGAGRYVCPGGW